MAGTCHSAGRFAADTHTREMAVVGASNDKLGTALDCVEHAEVRRS